MKKLLLLFAAFLIGLAQMQAGSFYVVGEFNTGKTDWWSTDYKADDINRNTEYTISDVPVGNKGFQIHLDWGNNYNRFFSNKSTVQLGANTISKNWSRDGGSNGYDCSTAGDQMKIAGALEGDTYDIEVKVGNDDNSITLTVTLKSRTQQGGTDPRENKTIKYWSNGGGNNFGEKTLDTYEGEGVYSTTISNFYANHKHGFVLTGSVDGSNWYGTDTTDPANGVWTNAVYNKNTTVAPASTNVTVKVKLNDAGTKIEQIYFDGIAYTSTDPREGKTITISAMNGVNNTSWNYSAYSVKELGKGKYEINISEIYQDNNNFYAITMDGKNYTVNADSKYNTTVQNNTVPTNFPNGEYAAKEGYYRFTTATNEKNVKIIVEVAADGNSISKLTFSGLSTGGNVNPNPDPKSYTIYFYDKAGTFTTGSGEGSDDFTIYAHLYKGTTGFKTWKSDEAKMTRITDAKRFVLIQGQYYPVWKYEFDWDIAPEKVIIYYTDTNGVTKQYDTEIFGNNSFYSNAGDPEMMTLISKDSFDGTKTSIYFHLKADGIKNYDFDLNADVNVEVGVYKANKDNNWLGTDYYDFTGINTCLSDATNPNTYVAWTPMVLLNKDYQMYGANINVAGGNLSGNDMNVVFRYRNPKDNNKYVYWVSWYWRQNENSDNSKWNLLNDDVDISKYIWTTATTYGTYLNDNLSNKPGAIQSYATYADFEKSVIAEPERIYLVGNWNIKFKDSNDREVTLPNNTNWELLSDNYITAYKEDPSCFYFTIDKADPNFKMSYIDVTGTAKNNGYTSGLHNQRKWATFDLGCIGIDTDKTPSTLAETDTYYRTVTTKPNAICPIGVFNQYNVIGSQYSGKTINAVVDMHPSCRSVTFLSFDPKPSATITNKGLQNNMDVRDSFDDLWMDQHLNACDANGHIKFDYVNKITNEVTYTPSSGVTDAGFMLNYTVEDQNGNPIIDYMDDFITASQVSTMKPYEMVMAPNSSSQKLNTICWYHDDTTKFNSHSKHGSATMSGNNTTLFAPALITPQVEWVAALEEQELDPADKDRVGTAYFGMVITGLDDFKFDMSQVDEENRMNPVQDMNAHADFKVTLKKTGEELPAYILHNEITSVNYKGQEFIIPEFTEGTLAANGRRDYHCFKTESTWNSNEADHSAKWSYYMTQNPEDHYQMSVYVPVAAVPYYWGGDYVKYMNDTYGNQITIDYDAIYPFLIPSNKVSAASEMEGAPRRITPRADQPMEIKLSRQTTLLAAEANGDNISTALKQLAADIEAATCAPVYYNLQGVKVEKPGKGLYIEVRGKESKKVLF